LVGKFKRSPFTILEQLADPFLLSMHHNGNRNIQSIFLVSLTVILPFFNVPDNSVEEVSCPCLTTKSLTLLDNQIAYDDENVQAPSAS
jgi:hypothetical protein